MTKSDFLRTYEESLRIEPDSIDATALLKDVAWWDSMAAIAFISLADEKLDVLVSGVQLQECQSVADLLRLLGDKLVD